MGSWGSILWITGKEVTFQIIKQATIAVRNETSDKIQFQLITLKEFHGTYSKNAVLQSSRTSTTLKNHLKNIKNWKISIKEPTNNFFRIRIRLFENKCLESKFDDRRFWDIKEWEDNDKEISFNRDFN